MPPAAAAAAAAASSTCCWLGPACEPPGPWRAPGAAAAEPWRNLCAVRVCSSSVRLLGGLAALSSATWPTVKTATHVLWSAAASALLLLLWVSERLSMYLQATYERQIQGWSSLRGMEHRTSVVGDCRHSLQCRTLQPHNPTSPLPGTPHPPSCLRLCRIRTARPLSCQQNPTPSHMHSHSVGSTIHVMKVGPTAAHSLAQLLLHCSIHLLAPDRWGSHARSPGASAALCPCC
jgi:hypothetical protein